MQISIQKQYIERMSISLAEQLHTSFKSILNISVNICFDRGLTNNISSRTATEVVSGLRWDKNPKPSCFELQTLFLLGLMFVCYWQCNPGLALHPGIVPGCDMFGPWMLIFSVPCRYSCNFKGCTWVVSGAYQEVYGMFLNCLKCAECEPRTGRCLLPKHLHNKRTGADLFCN